MDRLRGDGGCPWDREQDARSLRPFLLEESHELLEALDQGDAARVREELGDVLFQVVFHARLAQENGSYDLGAVAHGIAAKLVRRHPHVFAGAKVDGVRGVLETWEQHKKREGRKSVLDGVPAAMPALLRAQRLQEKASRVGFDWKDAQGPASKLDEEIAEVKDALAKGDTRAALEELGDLLFSVVNVVRHLGGNAEDSLRESARKFERRFRSVEASAASAGEPLEGKSIEELDRLWEAAKAEERPAR
ncbi:nucleoside triphosphate pyrophosphohydrolase [bacterium]|nr:nucleoside triphosphate pyrophosphohydrolase [bacterium]